jgi:hypothetical protein
MQPHAQPSARVAATCDAALLAKAHLSCRAPSRSFAPARRRRIASRAPSRPALSGGPSRASARSRRCSARPQRWRISWAEISWATAAGGRRRAACSAARRARCTRRPTASPPPPPPTTTTTRPRRWRRDAQLRRRRWRGECRSGSPASSPPRGASAGGLGRRCAPCHEHRVPSPGARSRRRRAIRRAHAHPPRPRPSSRPSSRSTQRAAATGRAATARGRRGRRPESRVGCRRRAG